jgi:predicted kinase
MKTLLLICGLPRSGKSTYARNTGYPIVSPDAIRLAIHGQSFISQAEYLVWPLAKLMAKALFKAGHDVVILDACNITEKRRAEWLSDEWECNYWIIDSSKEECIKRAIEDGKPELVPVIERMAENAEWPGTIKEEQENNGC